MDGGILTDGDDEPGGGGEGVARAAKGGVVGGGGVGDLRGDGAGYGVENAALDCRFEVFGAVPVLIVDAGTVSDAVPLEGSRGSGRSFCTCRRCRGCRWSSPSRRRVKSAALEHLIIR